MTRTHTLPRHARCRVDVLVALSRLPGVDPVDCARWLVSVSDEAGAGPIVDVAELLKALPAWSRAAVREALARLEAELLVVDRSAHRDRRLWQGKSLIREAWAVQLTAAGVKAARTATAAPPRTPEAILAELRAVLAGASSEQRERDLAALRDLVDAKDGAA